MNARSANNYGLELDIRKQLDFIGLKDFSWSFNGALIHSRVRFAPGSNEYDRPMQGQSPYLVNTGVFYYNEPLQLSVNLLYNRIGKRIVGVGRTTGGGDASRNIRVPDSYEMPRDAFDGQQALWSVGDQTRHQRPPQSAGHVQAVFRCDGAGRGPPYRAGDAPLPSRNEPQFLGHSHTLISPRRCVGAKGHCISKKNNVKSTSGVGASPLTQHNN